MSVLADGARLAVGTLTRVRVAPPALVDRARTRVSVAAAPVTAVPPMLLLVLLHLVAPWVQMPAMVLGLVAVGALAWWSRALHLDGLADTTDGFASGYDRDRSLAVMRRGDIGPAGVVALVLVLVLQAAAIGALLPTGGGTALASVALLASRFVLAIGCWERVPAARAEGLGATFARSVPDGWLAVLTVAVTAIALLVDAVGDRPWYAGPLVALGAVAGAAVVLRAAHRRIGGVTGDVLGASVEVALTTALLVALVLR